MTQLPNYQIENRPTWPCDRAVLNPSQDGGNPPRLFRHFRTGGTLHTEPIYESGPLFIECWFMNGYRSYLLCRPVDSVDAKENIAR